jgi:WD40 repeat protein
LLDLATSQFTWVMHAHSGAVTCLAFAPDGRTILSGGADGALVLSDAATGRALHTLARGQAAVRAAQFSGDGERIVATVGDDGRTTRSWNLGLGAEFSGRAKAARASIRAAGDESFAVRLRRAEWYVLQGQPAWSRQALSHASPQGLDARSQLAVARVLWSADDAAAASSSFAAALANDPATPDRSYLALCRDAAAGGGP